MIMVVIVLFTLGLAAVFGYRILSEMNDEMQADADLHTEAKAVMTTVDTNYPSWIDSAFLLTLILLWGLLIVTSFMIDSHPVFFVLTLVLLLFVFIVGMALSNAYQDVTADSDLTASANAFPVINWVMGHFLIVLIVIGLSSALSLYAKNRL